MVPTQSRARPRRRRPAIRIVLSTSAALLAALTAVATVTTANADAPPPPSGWSQVFVDDFNGPANTLPSGSDWQYGLGHGYPGGPANWGTGEIQNYTNSTQNVSLDGGGNLRITPHRDGGGNARVESRRGDFRAPEGGVLRIESRIQMPNVTGTAAEGYWPAFWALGSPYRGNWWNWPGIGEFDIMENVNGLNTVWGVLHCGTAPGGPCNEFNGIGASRACPGPSCQSAFHTYRFDWDRSVSPNQLRWYVNDELFHTVNQNQLPADTWNNMTSHAGYYLIFNVAMGGAFPNGVSGRPTPTPATASGHPMVVDYVSVWQRGGGNPGGQNVLPAGQRLVRGQQLTSPNGRFHLVMQTDGNLVLYDGAPGQNPFWDTGTWSLPPDRRPTHADMQTDGNFVLYNDAGQPAWAAGTFGSFINPYLDLQDDGNLVTYHNGRTPIWASNTVRP